jgi:hypothetical protein
VGRYCGRAGLPPWSCLRRSPRRCGLSSRSGSPAGSRMPHLAEYGVGSPSGQVSLGPSRRANDRSIELGRRVGAWSSMHRDARITGFAGQQGSGATSRGRPDDSVTSRSWLDSRRRAITLLCGRSRSRSGCCQSFVPGRARSSPPPDLLAARVQGQEPDDHRATDSKVHVRGSRSAARDRLAGRRLRGRLIKAMSTTTSSSTVYEPPPPPPPPPPGVGIPETRGGSGSAEK